ncbi:MAG: hypothetical protein H7235_07430 [Bdellovibrionaceae bacterium]|nr:hypothetical protein [Pseudobdellovibrionaceae bacterium]
MKIINILCLVLMVPELVLAKKISVSPTLAIKVPFTIQENADLVGLNSKYLNIKGKEKSTLIVTYNKPSTVANTESVSRYWKTAQEQVAVSSKSIKDLGCKRLDADLFKCQRTSMQSDNFISEILFWKGKTDLVLLRLTSNTSLDTVNKIGKAIQVETNKRKVAGAQK